MWPFKDGYPYIVVNFGGYHLCRTLQEALGYLAESRRQRDPDTQLYSDGFYSERVGAWVGKGQWFPVKINGENV